MNVPFLNPSVEEEDIDRAVEVMRSGWYTMGANARSFEESLRDYLGVADVVMTNSCTSALHLSLKLAGIKEGDEVITTPTSYVATSNEIIHERAMPVFVDIDMETGLIDLDKIEQAITDKTKAIIPVHLYGQMVDMKKLKALADKYNLAIIEDAAHAIEAERDGIKPGQLGFSACFSFHVAKNITCGQGGAFATNDKSHAELARVMRRDGVVNKGDRRQMITFGYKYVSTDFQAAMLVGQLKRIAQTHAARVKVFERYEAGLKDHPGISFPKRVTNAVHAGHMFAIWVDPAKRDDIRSRLAEVGVETSIHYLPIHLEPYYQKQFNFKKGDFPQAELLGDRTIILPTHAKLTEEQQQYVIDELYKSV